MMCVSICAGFLGILSYLWLFILPVLGSFYGVEAVLRLSLLLAVQTCATSLLPTSMVLAEPLLQLAVTVGLLSLPLSFTPTLVVWLYDKLLWATEPLWLAIEAVGIVCISVTVTHKLVQRMDERPGTSKATILCIAAFCYCLFFDVSSAVLMSKSLPVKWLLVFVIFMTAAVHLAMWASEHGVLSDAAVVSVASVVLAYSQTDSSVLTQTAPPTPLVAWDTLDPGISFVKLLFNAVTQVSGNLTLATDFLSRLLSAWFLAAMMVRVVSVLFAVSYIVNSYEDEDTLELEDLDLDGDSLSSAFSAWRCPLLVRLTLLVVYTQFVVFHLLSADSATRGWLVPLPALHGLCLTRVVQILLVNGVYLWYLRAEE